MRDVTVTVQLSFAVDKGITMGELRDFISQAINAKLDEALTAHDHGAPLPRIAYNGEPVEAFKARFTQPLTCEL